MARMYFITVLLLSIACHAQAMEQVSSRRASLPTLPLDAQLLLVTSLVADTLVKATNTIKSLASVNRVYHDFVNDPDTMLFIIKTIAITTMNRDERDVAARLRKMPGKKSALVQRWMAKRCKEIPKEIWLIAAVQQENYDKVKELLGQKVDPNALGKYNLRPLAVAAWWNKEPAITQLLLVAGADPNLVSKEKRTTALYVAVQAKNKKAVDSLLSAGADPNIPIMNDDTPLMCAIVRRELGIVNTLINAGAIIDRQNKEGYSPILAAAQEGTEEIIDRLVAAKANVNILSFEQKNSALILVAWNGRPAAADKLIKAGAKVNHQNADGATALYVATQKGYREIVRHLLDAQADPNLPVAGGDTPLLIAASAGYTPVAAMLIESGALVNQKNKLGRTALMLAASNNHVPVMNLLLDAGADQDSIDAHGNTAFTYADVNKNLKAVETLLKRGGIKVGPTS